MNIAWVSHGSSLAGGAELSMSEAVKGLIEAGHKVHMAVPEWGALADRLIGFGAEVSAVPGYASWVYSGFTPNLHYRVRRLVSNLWRGRRLARLFKQLQADLVVSSTIGSPAGALAARWADVPHIWCVHELFGAEGQDQASFDLGAPLSLRLMDKLSSRVVVNSSATLEKYKDWIPAEKLRLIYYAVEVSPLPAKTEIADERLRLVIVGRIAPGKRQEDAVRAVSLLARRGLDVQLSIVGNHGNDYGAFLQRLTQELAIEDHVTFVGYTSDPHSFVAESDLALVCSRGESFGRVTVEAMKLGKPVVGAADAGTNELVRDGVNGLLYRFGDVEELSRCIESVYRNKDLRKKMGAAAKEWANAQFSLEKHTSALINIFEEVRTESRMKNSRGVGKH
ncbi:MAG: glycosyltransferase family 4 protein [Blastocatellales bacterium]